MESEGETVIIDKENGFIEVHVRQKDDFRRKQQLIWAFYKSRSRDIFSKSLEKMAKTTGISFIPEIKVRKIKKESPLTPR
jgi:predicted metal-dependent hydrolase